MFVDMAGRKVIYFNQKCLKVKKCAGDDMNNTASQTEFICNWLQRVKSMKPESLVIQGIADATNNCQLDEAKLLRRLRELSKLTEENKEK